MGGQRVGLCALFCAQVIPANHARLELAHYMSNNLPSMKVLATSNPKFTLNHRVHAFVGGFPTLFVHMLDLAYHHFSSNPPNSQSMLMVGLGV